MISRIKKGADAILNALYAQEYQILHLAGHGVYEHAISPEGKTCECCQQKVEKETVTGMVASQPPEGEIRISFGTGDNRASRAWSWNPAALIPELFTRYLEQGWRVYPEKRPRPGDEQGPADETYPGQSGFRLQDGRNAPGVRLPFLEVKSRFCYASWPRKVLSMFTAAHEQHLGTQGRKGRIATIKVRGCNPGLLFYTEF